MCQFRMAPMSIGIFTVSVGLFVLTTVVLATNGGPDFVACYGMFRYSCPTYPTNITNTRCGDQNINGYFPNILGHNMVSGDDCLFSPHAVKFRSVAECDTYIAQNFHVGKIVENMLHYTHTKYTNSICFVPDDNYMTMCSSVLTGLIVIAIIMLIFVISSIWVHTIECMECKITYIKRDRGNIGCLSCCLDP
jgi:hypothetical protein